jgi:hypothetical protein
MEGFLAALKKWKLHWTSFYLDLDRKKDADAAYCDAENNSVHVGTLRSLLDNDVGTLTNDRETAWGKGWLPNAGFALRLRLKQNAGDIKHKFVIRASGTKFSWGFIFHILLASYLLFGSEVLGFLIPERAAIARNMPTDIRSIVIYYTLFRFWAITNELLMRIVEDRLLSAIISTTAYLVVTQVGGLRYLYELQWFKWTIVGATGVFVLVVSARRAILNGVLNFFIGRACFSADLVTRVQALRNQLNGPTNQLLDMIDDHEEVESTWDMIFGTSKLSSDLSIRNSFLKEDIGDLLNGLDCCLPPAEGVADRALRVYPRLWTWLGVSLIWLFGEGGHTYRRTPKLFMAGVTAGIMVFAVLPFKDFPFVMGTAVVWGVRCFLRILFPALSPYQSVRDVLKIFGSFVSSGLLDAPYSIALLSTDFKAFDNTVMLVLLTLLATVLVLTVSDAIGPLALYFAEKWGWVDPPDRRRRCDGA